MNAARLLLGLLVALLLAAGLWYSLGQPAGPRQLAALERQLPSDELGRGAPVEELAVGAHVGGELARSEPELKSRPVPSTSERAGRAKRSLLGRVVDEFGEPIAGARVVYAVPPITGVRIDELGVGGTAWAPTQETNTAADGSYRLDYGTHGRVSLAVRSPGFAPLRVERELEHGAEVRIADLVLEKGVVLSGHVVDSSGVGIGGAQLVDRRLASSSGFSYVSEFVLPLAVTDESGAFTIDELPAGPFRLGVEHEAYPTTLATGNIARAGERKTGERYILVDGFEISGHLLGLEAGEADSFVVRARPVHRIDFDPEDQLNAERSAELDVTGGFTLRGLRGGLSYSVRAILVTEDALASASGHTASSVVVASAGERGIELELLGSQALTFRVVDDVSGEPLTEFKVDAGSPRLSALRDAKGQRIVFHPEGKVRFQDIFRRAGSGGVNLRIEAQGYVTLNRAGITLASGEDTDLGVLRLVPAPMIDVRVIDAQSGEPVQHAKVGLRRVRASGAGPSSGEGDAPGPLFTPDEELHWVRTNEQGVAELASLPGERFELLVRHKWYAERVAGPFSSPAVASTLADKPEFEVALYKGGTVIVHVLDAKGEPQQGVEVEHRSPGEARRVITLGGAGGQKSGADGTLTYRYLSPGVHHFKLTEDSASSAFGGGQIVIAGLGGDPAENEGGQEVLVSEGSEDEITLRAKPRGMLEGKVTENGEPLAGAIVTFVEKRDDGDERPRFTGLGVGETTRKTDSKGEYSGLDLKVGEYTARISHPTRSMAESYTVLVTEGRQSCDFALTVAVLEGRVVDSEGRCVPGVKVKPKRHREQATSQVVMASIFVEDAEGGGGVMTFNSGRSAVPEVFTDQDGNYSLRGVVPDVELYVESSHAAYQAARSEVVVVSEGQTRGGVDITVLEAGSIQVQVVMPLGESYIFCTLDASYEGESDEPVADETAFVEEDHTARLQSLRPGPWRLSLRHQYLGGEPQGAGGASSSEPVMVEVLAGETQTVTLELP